MNGLTGKSTVPKVKPKMTLKSTDGKISLDVFVTATGTNTYYFDRFIEGIDTSKEYVFEITSGDSRNISPNKSMNVIFKNQTIGRYQTYNIFIASNKIKFGSISKLSTGTYGQSGLKVKGDSRGSDLKYYKIGNGPNVFFGTFALHGFEDGWPNDGYELVLIAENFVDYLCNSNTSSIEKKWTIYIFPEVNPDAVRYGYSNNGPGRHTLYSLGPKNMGIDINRCWPSGYSSLSGRYYNGSAPLQSYEAVALKDFLSENKSKNGETILIDLHGWTTQLIGNQEISLNYYAPQFYKTAAEARLRYVPTYGSGYLINWARVHLNAKSALIELPNSYNGKIISNHNDVLKANYSIKYRNSTIDLLNNIIK